MPLRCVTVTGRAHASSPVGTASRLHERTVSMAAGHDSATLDKGTGGDVGGHVPFLPLVDALQLPGPQQRGVAMRPSPTRDHFGVVNNLGLLAV